MCFPLKYEFGFGFKNFLYMALWKMYLSAALMSDLCNYSDSLKKYILFRQTKKKNPKKIKENDRKPLLKKESIHDLQLELDLSSKML